MNDTKTVSGAIVHVTDADEAPLVRCLVDIEPKQSGTGTPSPSNVRPISGWESVVVGVNGKNFLENTGTSTTASGVTLTVNSDKSITVSGTATATVWFNINFHFNLSKGTFILSGGDEFYSANAGSPVSYLDFRNNAGGIHNNIRSTIAETRFTLTESVEDFRISLNVISGKTANYTIYPMIRRADDTDLTYEPYIGTTTTVNLGRTVYGGTLDVVSGSLTDKMGIVDLGTLTWTYQTSTGLFYSNGFPACKNNTNKLIFSNREWTPKPNQNEVRATDKTICKDSNGRFYVHDSSYNTTADFQSAMSGSMMVYELATPQTYTLTGQEVSTLLGDNNVWADSGDVEITYHTDTLGIFNKIYINGRPYFRPNDFEIKREDVYAGEYTTCTGKLIADKIGWKYSDLPMKWDILPDEDLVYLTTLTGAFDLIFRDSDGQHTEQVIRRGFANTPTRLTGPNGAKLWTGLEMEISFLNTHPIDEE